MPLCYIPAPLNMKLVAGSCFLAETGDLFICDREEERNYEEAAPRGKAAVATTSAILGRPVAKPMPVRT